MMKRYLYNLALAVDQLTNVLLLGDPDESLSGRCGRALQSGRPKYWVKSVAMLIDSFALLASGEKNHCLNSIEPEERPVEKRNLELDQKLIRRLKRGICLTHFQM